MSKEEFLSIAESYYPEFESLKDTSNFYDYEKSIIEMMQKICCDYMKKQLNEGSVSKDRRKKNCFEKNIFLHLPPSFYTHI